MAESGYIHQERTSDLQGERTFTLENGANVIDRIPENISDSVPVLIAPGWSETLKSIEKELAIANAAEKFVLSDGTSIERGRRTIAVEHPRTTDKRFSNQLERKADTIGAIFEHYKDIPEFDILAHSEAAVNTIIAAAHHPDRVRNIVLVNPAGTIGKDSFLRLYTAFNKMIGQDVLRSMRDGKFRGGFTKTAAETMRYLAKNPKLAVREVQDMTKADIFDEIKDLHDMGKGIAIIHAADDPLFPSDKIRSQLVEAAKIGNSPIVDQILETTGGHNALNSRPDIHIRQALRTLDLLNLRKDVGRDKSVIVGDKLLLTEDTADES